MSFNVEIIKKTGVCFPHDIMGFSKSLKPYAMLTFSTNNSGKYEEIIDTSFKAKILKKDVNNIMLRLEQTFWNTNNVPKNVNYYERFHGIGFFEKLETNPHCHILLYFPEEAGLISEDSRKFEINRRMHFLVSEYLKTGDEIKLYPRDQSYRKYPKVRQWDFLSHEKTGIETMRRRNAFKSVLPGGEFHVASILNTDDDVHQVCRYSAKELNPGYEVNDESFFLLSESMSFNHYRGKTKVPALGGCKTTP